MGSILYHEHRPAPVEPRPIAMLPDVLDPVCVPSDEPPDDVLVRALYCLCVPLERTFSPTDCTVLRLDTNEEPPGRHAEYLSRPCSAVSHSTKSGHERSAYLDLSNGTRHDTAQTVGDGEPWLYRALHAGRTATLPGQLYLRDCVRPEHRLRTLRRSPVYTRHETDRSCADRARFGHSVHL